MLNVQICMLFNRLLVPKMHLSIRWYIIGQRESRLVILSHQQVASLSSKAWRVNPGAFWSKFKFCPKWENCDPGRRLESCSWDWRQAIGGLAAHRQWWAPTRAGGGGGAVGDQRLAEADVRRPAQHGNQLSCHRCLSYPQNHLHLGIDTLSLLAPSGALVVIRV